MNKVKICFFIVMMLISTSIFPLVNSNDFNDINDVKSCSEKATLFYNYYNDNENKII